MKAACTAIALISAAAIAWVGVARGTYAAGGSDSSCYALMADAFAAGQLQPASTLAARVPWPDAGKTFTPGGFVTSETDPSAAAPVCAPGFSLLLAPFVAIGGLDAMFLLTPLAGALLVWMTFAAGSALMNPVSGAMAAVLVACSPVTLYQIVQPMNDVTTAALWMAVFVALLSRRWTLAGLSCGVALLVRPNLLPVAVVAGVFVISTCDSASLFRRVAAFAVAALPFALLVLWLNSALYGSPFRTGYGQLGQLFGVSGIPLNASRYFRWLVDTHTPFPLLAVGAPFVVQREKRADAMFAIGVVVATSAVYFLYTPFDDWSYLRFLLPAIAVMFVLASIVFVQLVQYVVSGFSRSARVFNRFAIPAAMTAAIAVFCVRTAEDRLAFNLHFLEQRYRSAGIIVRDRLPENAVVLSVWDSGAVRFHGRKEALSWAGLDPAWLDRSLAWLDEHGRPPYILVESWEEPAFRNRFANNSDAGKLDWPPRYEIDRVVRIFDPKDRAKYVAGENINTEFLWPLRD